MEPNPSGQMIKRFEVGSSLASDFGYTNILQRLQNSFFMFTFHNKTTVLRILQNIQKVDLRHNSYV